ncbi:MAG: heme lyase CcmF/NrfE family subunit [Paracoccaceae bacterium]|jgi:cytochrome c-type biogenesis protein CcmF|tara:strand:- start:4028 stop:5989 length:1962 start_codon:yes stop_codon:yes gene_type:complete
MLNEIGHFTLLLAFCVALIQATVPLFGANKGRTDLMAIAESSANLQFALLLASFAALTHAFVTSDFSVKLVVLNSHSLKPMLYKVTGVWGNHEGSMLLWVLILSLFGASASWFGKSLPILLKTRVLSVQGAIGVAFLAFIIFTSNPFERMQIPPFDGQDLNPLLQDPGLAFHPPFLYLGYVGLSMAFSFAVAALIEGRIDAAWGRWVRPWTLAAWIFLTIGIALGSWWAYYELGWGGFWFWDPVENASFMPWLLAAALLHSAIVVEKRETLKSWTILLAILAFGFSLIGTFIVRSGVLTSVHAFANDPERGLFILIILGVFMGGALILFSLRSSAMEAQGIFSLVSRETALISNNLLLAVSAFVVFFGTIWPLVAELFFDRKLSVGPPFFNAAFTPFMILLGLILPLGSNLSWKRAYLTNTVKKLLPVLILCLCFSGFIWSIQTGQSLIGPMGVFLGTWIVVGTLVDLLSKLGSSKSVRRLIFLPRADYGKFFAHVGLGVTMFAIAALTSWEKEDIRVVPIGSSWALGSYELKLENIIETRGPNYFSTMGIIQVSKKGLAITTLRPEKRNYPIAQMPTTEAAIDYRISRDLYVVLGDKQSDKAWTVRTYLKPFTNWIWGGCALMAFGGFLSLTDRRLRIAAGSKMKKSSGQTT